jgi:hypothetical protein
MMINHKWYLRCFVVYGLLACATAFGLEENPGGKAVAVIDPEFQKMHQNAVDAQNAGELFRSRAMYLELLSKYPHADNFQEIQNEFWNINIAIIKSPLQSRQTEIYTIKPRETLGKIARKIGSTVELIKRRNQMETSRIIAGHKLSVWKGIFVIEIDKSDNTLTLKTGDEIVKVYPVSTGKNNSSPVGSFVIKDRYTDPVWFHKGDVVPADDPKNFLGTRWLGFDLPKYGIHGTIEPERIGKQVSSGCIRMRNEDVQELYDLVPVGTKVTIVD